MQIIVFKLALKPTFQQQQILSSHVGASRYAYNWTLNYIKTNWDNVKSGVETEYIDLSFYSLRNALNKVKDDIAPWHTQNSKDAFGSGVQNASRAIKNWQTSKKNKAGKKKGFPVYKTRNHDTQTGVTFDTRPIKLIEGKNFKLPKMGIVKLYENPKALRRLLTQGGRISQVTASKKENNWFIAVNVKVTDELALQYFSSRKKQKLSKGVLGLDVGIKSFLVSSNGEIIENPAFLKKSLAKLRKANKRLARRRALDRKTGEVASARWDKAHQQLLKQHAHIANQRSDFIHKLTKSLVDENKVIALETLNIKSMMRNRHLSRSIADASWGELNRQLDYKSKRYGSQVVRVGRFYPSSKTCSGCGAVKAKLSLSERTYKCEGCGLVIDRDLNAAINIKNEALRLLVAQSCGETLNERGGKSSGLVNTTGETITNEALSSPRLQPVKR